jgi:LEA14-like dessication related protein
VNRQFLKTALITATAFIAYRGYKLWELINSFSYRYTSLYFIRPKNVKELLDSFGMVLEIAIMNPTATSVTISGVHGGVFYKNTLIGTYRIGQIKVQPAGDTPVKIQVRVASDMAAQIAMDITKKQFPVFDVRANVDLLFGITKQIKFTVDSKDYVPAGLTNVFV